MGLYSSVASFLMGLGVNVLRPHSLLRSLLLCHKINMQGATLVRVNINTPAAGPGVSQGSAACGGGKDGDYSSTLTAAPTRHQRVRNSHPWCYVNSVWRINDSFGVSGLLFSPSRPQDWRFRDLIYLTKLWVVVEFDWKVQRSFPF